MDYSLAVFQQSFSWMASNRSLVVVPVLTVAAIVGTEMLFWLLAVWGVDGSLSGHSGVPFLLFVPSVLATALFAWVGRMMVISGLLHSGNGVSNHACGRCSRR